jgi:hypothetical protein
VEAASKGFEGEAHGRSALSRGCRAREGGYRPSGPHLGQRVEVILSQTRGGSMQNCWSSRRDARAWQVRARRESVPQRRTAGRQEMREPEEHRAEMGGQISTGQNLAPLLQFRPGHQTNLFTANIFTHQIFLCTNFVPRKLSSSSFVSRSCLPRDHFA